MSEFTAENQKPHLFKPGQSGNPAGRPKGSRNKLGEEFIRALYDDFSMHGVDVIKAVREEKPDVYLKVVASLMPVEISGEVVHFVARIPQPSTDPVGWKAQHGPKVINGHASRVDGQPKKISN